MKDKIFKDDAKQIVDLAFDGKILKDSVTRDDMNTFEELIEFLLSSKFEAYKKTEALFNRMSNIDAMTVKDSSILNRYTIAYCLPGKKETSCVIKAYDENHAESISLTMFPLADYIKKPTEV